MQDVGESLIPIEIRPERAPAWRSGWLLRADEKQARAPFRRGADPRRSARKCPSVGQSRARPNGGALRGDRRGAWTLADLLPVTGPFVHRVRRARLTRIFVSVRCAWSPSGGARCDSWARHITRGRSRCNTTGSGSERDTRPLFREKDVRSMSSAFDLPSYEDVRGNAGRIVATVARWSMPYDGPRPAQRVGCFAGGLTPAAPTK